MNILMVLWPEAFMMTVGMFPALHKLDIIINVQKEFVAEESLSCTYTILRIDKITKYYTHVVLFKL